MVMLAAYQAGAVKWYNNTEEAISESSRLKRPMMWYFSASSWAECGRLEKDTFENPAVMNILDDNFVCVRLSYEDNESLFQYTYQIIKPTVMFYNLSGKMIEKVSGYCTPQDFIGTLEKIYAEATGSAIQHGGAAAYATVGQEEHALPTETFDISAGLKDHYKILRDEIFRNALKNSRHQNMRFYISALLHDFGQRQWPMCERYTGEYSSQCGTWVRDKLKDLSLRLTAGKSQYEAIKSVYAYIRQNIKSDKEQEEMPRFPYETLTYGSGDCEDKAMLAASLLKFAGYDVAFVLVFDFLSDFGHAFCIVRVDPDTFPGPLWKFDRYSEYGNSWRILDPAYGTDFDQLPSWMNSYIQDGKPYLPPHIVEDIIEINEEELEKLSSDDDKWWQSPLLKESSSRKKTGSQPDSGVAESSTAKGLIFHDPFDIAPSKILGLDQVRRTKDEWEKYVMAYASGESGELSNEEVVKGVRSEEKMLDNIVVTVVEDKARSVPLSPDDWKSVSPARAGEMGGTALSIKDFPVIYKRSGSENVADMYFEIDRYSVYITGRNKYADEEKLSSAADEVISHMLRR